MKLLRQYQQLKIKKLIPRDLNKTVAGGPRKLTKDNGIKIKATGLYLRQIRKRVGSTATNDLLSLSSQKRVPQQVQTRLGGKRGCGSGSWKG